MKRELNKEEKDMTQKSVERDEKELNLFELQLSVLRTELRILPDKYKLMEHVKKEEIRKTEESLNFLHNKVTAMRKQLKEGVESKGVDEE